MSKLIVDTNVLMDCVMFEFCQQEMDSYEKMVEILRANYISSDFISESLTNKEMANIIKAMNKRKERFKNLASSVENIVKACGNPELVITKDIEIEFKRNLTSGDININKKKITSKDNMNKEKYIRKIVSRLLYSRYSSLVDECLSHYSIIPSYEDITLEYPYNNVDAMIFNNGASTSDVIGIVTINRDDFVELNKFYVPKFKVGLDVYFPYFWKVGYDIYPWNRYLNENLSYAEHILNLFEDNS